MSLRPSLVTAVLMACLTLPLAAEAPPVLLTVTGLDPAERPGGSVAFDRAALEALGPVTFTTSSIWTVGPHTFTGIPLQTLARALDLPDDATLTLRALNDYEVDIPLAEAGPQAPLLAYLMDGQPMSVRDKGPIWVVYPYDEDPATYQTVTTFARSVWQLDRIEVSR